MKLHGKRVVVTGAAGFIGSHLTEQCVHAGARTRALVRYNSAGRRGWLDHSPLSGEIEFVAGDIRDPECVRDALRDADVVLHLAALIAIPYSYTAPRQYVDVNIQGTLNVLLAAREHSVSRVVHTSTSEVYGTARTVPITEDHPLVGQSPYAATKIGADQLATSFHRSFGTPVVVVRPFNTYGPRQSARAIIPTIISQALAGGPVRLGNLHPTRDLNFVDDTVNGFLAAASADSSVEGEVINLGTGVEVSIGDVARMILDEIDPDLTLESDESRMRPTGSEVERLIASNAKAAQLLGWQPRIALRDGLSRTIEWCRTNSEVFRPSEYAV